MLQVDAVVLEQGISEILANGSLTLLEVLARLECLPYGGDIILKQRQLLPCGSSQRYYSD